MFALRSAPEETIFSFFLCKEHWNAPGLRNDPSRSAPRIGSAPEGAIIRSFRVRNTPTLWNVPSRSAPRIGSAPEEAIFSIFSMQGILLPFGTFLVGALPILGVLLKRLFLVSFLCKEYSYPLERS